MHGSLSRHFLAPLFAVATAISIALVPIPAHAKDSPSKDLQEQQSLKLYREGKFQEALAYETSFAKAHPSSSRALTLLSYLNWQQGNILPALEEGESAVRLAPNDVIALTNLARMKEAASDSHTAIRLYERLAKLTPDDCRPRVSTARCYMRMTAPDVARAILKDVVREPGRTFDWYYQAADGCLQMDEPGLAAEAAAAAAKLATTQQQKSDSATQLMLALLRDHQIDRAKSVKKEAFKGTLSDNYEMFVRAAGELLPALNPDSAKDLIGSALNSLKSPDDAEGFYRMGRIFENKASYVAYDAEKVSAWLECAAIVYQKSVALDPMQARYHLALAGVLDHQHKPGAVAELISAHQLSGVSLIEPFLEAKIKSSNGSSVPIKLTSVHFSIKGLACPCHATRVETTLDGIKGVVSAGIEHTDEPHGIVLIDESATPVDEVFAQCKKSLDEFGQKMTTPEVVSFTLASRRSIDSAEEAIRIAQNQQFGDPLRFYNVWQVDQPVLPDDSHEQRAISAR